MPQKKSAAKALRQDQKQYIRSRLIKRKIKEIRKKAGKALRAKNLEESKKLYQDLQKAVDKASKSGGILKKNTASRYKSQILKKINVAKK
jgi:ribosomal protein S20